MQHFKNLLEVLKIEKDADYKLYQQKTLLTPLQERKKQGTTWYPVRLNSAEIGIGENLQITVERNPPTEGEKKTQTFQVGDAVALFCNLGENSKNPQPVSGVLSYLWKDTMRISISDDELPDWIHDGKLGVDQMFDGTTYREMEHALNKVREAENNRLAELRDILIGKEQAGFLQNGEILYFENRNDLNASQNEAIRNILAAQDLAIIHGPPGTGKTTTVVAAVQEVLKYEKQVLVTAPSNTAVDLLTERLAQKGVRVLRIGNPARVSEDLLRHSLEAQISEHEDYHFLRNLRRKAEEMRNMAFKYKRKYGSLEKQQRRLILAEAGKIKEDATFLEKYIVDSLVDGVQVITATLVGTVNKYIRHKQFKTIFIDEAAQALEPACWIAIAKAQRVIFAGDHCQLPPTVKSFEAAQRGLADTLFEQCIRNQKADTMLKVQYRMNEKIMQFSNQIFYKNELEAFEKVKNHLLSSDPDDPYLGKPVEFIDTAGCGFAEAQNPETLSRMNPEEAQVLIRHLYTLLEYIRDTHAEVLTETFSIGVISPYKAQVQLLDETIRIHPQLIDFKQFIEVRTVDGFQGQEKDVIYISMVRSNDKSEIGFLADKRRMNVALTRARKKLVVIGDSATLGGHGFYQDFLKYIDSIEAYRTAWEV